jgi:3-hydroxybutyryl-CoA dehydratase
MSQSQPEKTIDDMAMGLEATLSKTVTATDLDLFAQVTGDTNPVHLDDAYAAKTPFKTRIAHGMLSAGFISAVLGTKLPGPGAIYLSQSLKFKAPVRIGDHVTTRVVVTAIDTARRRVTFSTTCQVGDIVVVEGEAQIMVPAGRA